MSEYLTVCALYAWNVSLSAIVVYELSAVGSKMASVTLHKVQLPPSLEGITHKNRLEYVLRSL